MIFIISFFFNYTLAHSFLFFLQFDLYLFTSFKIPSSNGIYLIFYTFNPTFFLP